MKATVVLKEAATYRYKGYTFRHGIPQPVTNPQDIEDLQTNGMVQVTIEDEKQKVASEEGYSATALKKMKLGELRSLAINLGLNEGDLPETKKELIALIEEVQE